MKLVYPHWQHGRLIEGEIPNISNPLPVLTVFLWLGASEHIIIEGLTRGQLSLEEAFRALPTMRYSLEWFDGETAFYTMAQRWRDA